MAGPHPFDRPTQIDTARNALRCPFSALPPSPSWPCILPSPPSKTVCLQASSNSELPASSGQRNDQLGTNGSRNNWGRNVGKGSGAQYADTRPASPCRQNADTRQVTTLTPPPKQRAQGEGGGLHRGRDKTGREADELAPASCCHQAGWLEHGGMERCGKVGEAGLGCMGTKAEPHGVRELAACCWARLVSWW